MIDLSNVDLGGISSSARIKKSSFDILNLLLFYSLGFLKLLNVPEKFDRR